MNRHAEQCIPSALPLSMCLKRFVLYHDFEIQFQSIGGSLTNVGWWMAKRMSRNDWVCSSYHGRFTLIAVLLLSFEPFLNQRYKARKLLPSWGRPATAASWSVWLVISCKTMWITSCGAERTQCCPSRWIFPSELLIINKQSNMLAFQCC